MLGELVASPLLEQFASVWEDIGIEEAHLEGRRETIKVHLQVRWRGSNRFTLCSGEKRPIKLVLLYKKDWTIWLEFYCSLPSQTLLEEMLQEEVELKTKLEASVASCSEELRQLCRELSLPLEQPPEGWTLLAKEKHLRSRADVLTKVSGPFSPRSQNTCILSLHTFHKAKVNSYVISNVCSCILPHKMEISFLLCMRIATYDFIALAYRRSMTE